LQHHGNGSARPMNYYLSRLQLSSHPSTRALQELLDPKQRALAMDAHHRLIWSAFAGDPNSKRDFLWRAEGKGAFIVLSHRPPHQSELFEPAEVKQFEPNLKDGDALHFVLRVNATKTRPEKFAVKENGKPGDRRVDIVMHALKDIDPQKRAAERMNIARVLGQDWLASQGAKNGFEVQKCDAVDYSVVALPSHRGTRKGQPQFGVLDLTGVINVKEPDLLVAKLISGFGRAKAFGCGLMLIKRA
jgi:CRISPR system Cascade subunit CasE